MTRYSTIHHKDHQNPTILFSPPRPTLLNGRSSNRKRRRSKPLPRDRRTNPNRCAIRSRSPVRDASSKGNPVVIQAASPIEFARRYTCWISGVVGCTAYDFAYCMDIWRECGVQCRSSIGESELETDRGVET